MMPLTLANMGEENLIHRVGGSPEVKKHLEDLGFVAGGTVTVVAALGGNVDLPGGLILPGWRGGRWPQRSAG